MAPSEVLCRVGNFFVRKKDGRIRLIVDARAVYRICKIPPKTELASTAAIFELETDPNGEFDENIPPLYFSAQDISNCFYQFRISKFLQRFFGLKNVRAKDVGITELDGKPISGEAWLCPVVSVLPMGFSWAVHLTHSAHRELLARAGVGDRRQELTDRRPAPQMSLAKPISLIYIDNELFISYVGSSAKKSRQTAQTALETQGLPFHEVCDNQRLIEAIGLELDGLRHTARASRVKRWRLIRALEGLLSRPLVSGKQLEVIIGHYTYVALLNRSALSVLRQCYDYIRARYHVPSRLWTGVRKEIKVMIGLVPLLSVNCLMPWLGVAHCSDASPHGYAVHECELPLSTIQMVGRWNERWRFHWDAGSNPRARALGEKAVDIVPGMHAIDIVDEVCDGESGFSLNPEFPEVPASCLEEPQWKLIQAKPYHHPEAIHLKELRAVIFALQRKVRQSKYHNYRMLSFCDNLGIVLSLEKGRAASYPVLRLLRKVCSLCLAANVRFRVRWVPSERNPSDTDSRSYDPPSVATPSRAHQLASQSDNEPLLLRRDHAGQACALVADGSPEGLPRSGAAQDGQSQSVALPFDQCASTQFDSQRGWFRGGASEEFAFVAEAAGRCFAGVTDGGARSAVWQASKAANETGGRSTQGNAEAEAGRSGRSFVAGEECSWAKDFCDVSVSQGQLRQLLRQPVVASRKRRRDGQGSAGVSQRPVSGRCSFRRGHQAGGSCRPFLAEVSQEHAYWPPTLLSPCSTGLAANSSASNSTAAALADRRVLETHPGGYGLSSRSSRSHGGSRCVPAPGGVALHLPRRRGCRGAKGRKSVPTHQPDLEAYGTRAAKQNKAVR